MRLSLATGIFVAVALAASKVVASVNIEGVETLFARKFEDLELRRGGGATGGGHSAASAASASRSKIPNKLKGRGPTKSKSKPKSKKPKRAKECKDGQEPVASRELEELVERGGTLGKLAGHLSCPGEEHHARELLEELVARGWLRSPLLHIRGGPYSLSWGGRRRRNAIRRPWHRGSWRGRPGRQGIGASNGGGYPAGAAETRETDINEAREGLSTPPPPQMFH